MNILCDGCSLSIQVDDSKVPDGSFTVRCPRCQNMVRANGKSASVVEQLQANAAAPALDGKNAFSARESDFEVNKAIKSLLSALQMEGGATPGNDSDSSKPRRILLCLGKQSETASQILNDAGYKVYVAQTPAQANERLREGKTELMIFSSDFAVEFSGAAAVQKRINAIQNAERRRLFMVLLDDNVETLNAHQSFLRNLNLVVNSRDINDLPMILNRSVRDFNDLYHFFNRAVGAQPL